MNRRLRCALTVVLAVVFLASTGLMLHRQLGDRQVETTYQEALTLAMAAPAPTEAPAETLPPVTETVWVPAPVEEPDPHMEELAALDLAALQQVNPDVLGWIRIPDTKIDYPFLQGKDNDYYLKHTWEGRNNAAGSIFLECMNSPDLTDFNSIFYGHNMNSGAMFANLRKYTRQSFWETHPYVYLMTAQGVWRCEIFSAYKAPVDSHTYGLSFQQEETKAHFLATALEESQIETGVEPATTDRILTLSTCSGAGYTTRWVVHARLKMMETAA
nr:class B sortase [Oscillospiraceae bacterium]